MKRALFAVLVVVGVTLACGTYVTPTPTALPASGVTVVTPTPTRTARPTPTPTAAADEHVTIQATVNVRAEPDGIVIGSLASGEVVDLERCRDNWCKIRIERVFGYVWQGCTSNNPRNLGCEAR